MRNKSKIFLIILVIVVSIYLILSVFFVGLNYLISKDSRYQICQEVETQRKIIQKHSSGIDDSIYTYTDVNGSIIEEVWSWWSVRARDKRRFPNEPNTQLHLNLEQCQSATYWEVKKLKLFSKF